MALSLSVCPSVHPLTLAGPQLRPWDKVTSDKLVCPSIVI